jgi:hypothetical protein
MSEWAKMDFMGGLPLRATISHLRVAVAPELFRRLMSEPPQTQMAYGLMVNDAAG